MQMHKYLLIITLNVNVLNVPIKRHRVAEWIREQETHVCYLEENHLRKNINLLSTQTKAEEMEKKYSKQKEKKQKARL